MLEEQVDELKQKIVKTASIVREMIENSVNALIHRDAPMAKRVITELEVLVNQAEIDIDEECIVLIARYHPEAKFLRCIMMISKMVSDLERMGDHAVNIAESSIYLIDRPPVKPLIDLPHMLGETTAMFDKSITSFLNDDSKLAYEVLPVDDIVDDYRDQILRELITYMVSNATIIEASIQLIRIAENLEKIADVTSNICEEVIYIKEGKIVMHSKQRKEWVNKVEAWHI
jgi:phosphate transport system protein